MQKSEQPHIELKRAMRSIGAMKTAASLDDFEESWKAFLHRAERVWNKVANHYGKSPKWNGWQGKFGGFNCEVHNSTRIGKEISCL